MPQNKTSDEKEPKLGLTESICVLEGFIKHYEDYPNGCFAFVKKKYLPKVNRDIYYDFVAATARQYKKGDAELLLTKQGIPKLRRVCTLALASSMLQVEAACQENQLDDDITDHYLDVDFRPGFDKADRLHSARSTYLKIVNRKPSKTEPADRCLSHCISHCVSLSLYVSHTCASRFFSFAVFLAHTVSHCAPPTVSLSLLFVCVAGSTSGSAMARVLMWTICLTLHHQSQHLRW